MKLSPEIQEKFRKFRHNRRAFWSLVALAALFLAALPAELTCNDKPILLVLDGRPYLPAFRDYCLRDFGGAGELPITSYRSALFRNFLAGQALPNDPAQLFGDAARSLPIPAATAARPHRHWILWAPVRHSHKSVNANPQSGRLALIAPWSGTDPVTKATIGGAWNDGHYFGTDQEGKDVLARIVYGFRISMLFGLGLALSGTLIGCLFGAIQGFFGGWVDLLGQRIEEIWASLPQLYLLIIFSSFLAASKLDMTDTQHLLLLFAILNLTAWMGMSVQMRAQFLRGRNLEYVRAARALGVSSFRIMHRHILPNSLTPVITFFPFAVTGGILALVSLDFLSLGVKYPAPSLGELLAQGQANLHATWILTPTFLLLTVTLTLLTFIGDGVRNAFDPRTK